MKISKIKIQGKKQIVLQSQSENEVIALKHSFAVESATSGLDETHSIDLEDDDVLEFGFSDNTIWYSSPQSMSEIFPESSNQMRALNDEFIIPLSLGGGDERGIGNDIKLSALNIFKRNSGGESVGVIARELAKQFEIKNLKNQAGLFRVDEIFRLNTLEPTIAGGTYLLFLHGTASSTNGSFEDLCKPLDSKKDTWDYITKTYGKNILALQHESLTKTPLENVLDLVKALPADATFDIISQSRGGLVGEVFSRFCSGIGDNKGFTPAEINVLRNEYPSDFFEVYQRQINEISSIVKAKKFKIRRFIRSACPAHGTTLASSRLDTLVNVLVNGFGYITGWEDTKEFIALKKLAAAVVDCKNQVDILPGLEAMNPSSPFIKVLNNPNIGPDAYLIDNSLSIISGNAKASFSLKGLLIIVSKLFYKHKNDLIVDTASMYLGTRRGNGTDKKLVQFCFDEGKEVNHFNYFKNGSKTNMDLQEALKTEWGKPIAGFEEVKDSAINDMNRIVVLGALGAEIGEYSANEVSGKKPIVIIIPGIMGSNLSVGNNLTWLSYMKVVKGDLSKLAISAPNVSANSVIATSYKKLGTYLNSTYDVITFPFDWRKQLNTLTKDFAKKIEELLAYRQPIKIIAHSMGGVLVRDFMVTQTATWNTLNDSSSFKLLFLGSPLGGSFRIPAVLFGQDDIIDKLSKLDFKHNKKELLDIFTKFPGILSLLPLSTDTANDFAKLETWKTLAAGDSSWPMPTQDDLNNFAAYRDGILNANTSVNFKNAIYIAGKDKSTPCGYDIKETRNAKELVFLKTGEGDQSVTWETGIPKKMIESNTVYYVNVSHGALANEPKLFSAFTELLEKGSTRLLSSTRPIVSNEEKLFRSLANYNFDTTTDSIENALLGSEPAQMEEETPLEHHSSF